MAPGLLFLDRNQARGDDAFDDVDSDSDDSDFKPGEEGVESDNDDGYDDPHRDSNDNDGPDDDSATDDSDSNYHPEDDHSDTDLYSNYDSDDNSGYDSDDDGNFPPDPPHSAATGTPGMKLEEEPQQARANNNTTMGQPKVDNYYPQDFYDKTVDDDDEPPESAGVDTHPDDNEPPESTGVAPQDDGIGTVEHQEELDQEMNA